MNEYSWRVNELKLGIHDRPVESIKGRFKCLRELGFLAV